MFTSIHGPRVISRKNASSDSLSTELDYNASRSQTEQNPVTPKRPNSHLKGGVSNRSHLTQMDYIYHHKELEKHQLTVREIMILLQKTINNIRKRHFEVFSMS